MHIRIEQTHYNINGTSDSAEGPRPTSLALKIANLAFAVVWGWIQFSFWFFAILIVGFFLGTLGQYRKR